MTAPARPPPPPGIRGCHARGVPRSRGGGARRGWGDTVRWEASAAPCAADFDRLRRTAPAPEGPCAFAAPGSWLLVTPTIAPRVTARGAGGRVRAYCSLAFPLAVYVFSWEPSVWSGACIAGGGGRPRRPAPSRAQEGGREHPRRGRRGPLRRPAVERARKLLSAARWTNFFFFFLPSCGASLPPPIPAPQRPARPGWGGGAGVQGLGDPVRPPRSPLLLGPAPRAHPPPPPRSRSLRKLRP